MTASTVDSSLQLSTVSENDSNFAVICSFFYKFSASLGVNYNIQQLKEMIEDNNNLREELIELHIKLLRKRRKYINKDKWERALVKFCAEYSNVDAWELERYGYKNSKLSIKLEILKRLLEAQFDYNSKFKLEVNANEAASLRILPIGRDINGHMYWYQLDPELNFRIYREEAEDDQSWTLICQNKDQLETLISSLEANNTIECKEETSSLSDTNDENSNLIKLANNQIKEEPKNESSSDEKVSIGTANDMNSENTISTTENQAEVKVEPENSTGSESLTTNEYKLMINKNESIPYTNKNGEASKLEIRSDPNNHETDEEKVCLQNKLRENKDKCLDDSVKSEVEDKPIEVESTDIKIESSDMNQTITEVYECDAKIEKEFIEKPNDNEVDNELPVNEVWTKFPENDLKVSQVSDQVEDEKVVNEIRDDCDPIECDVEHVINRIVDEVSVMCCDLQSSDDRTNGTHQTIYNTSSSKSLLSIEQSVSILCDFLVDEVCRINTDNSDYSSADVSSKAIRGRGRPARARGRGRGRGRGSRGRGASSATRVDHCNSRRGRKETVEEFEDKEELSEQPVIVKRSSRRIQAIQEKKMQELAEKVKQEQARIEELAKKRSALLSAKEKSIEDFNAVNGSKKRRRKQIEKGCLDTSSDDEEADDSDSSKDTRNKKDKRKKKRKYGPNPWEETESSSDSDDNESEEIEENDDEEDVLKFDDNEDEFACEEIEPDAEPVVIRRARTVKKLRSESEDSDDSSSESEVENDDKPCGRCGKYDHPEWILLCDKCDDGFHTACLRPPLMLIPDGDWFCPPCEHKMLCERLHEELDTLSVQLVKKEREELRKKRLKHVAISVDNILKKPTRGERRKSSDDRNGIKSKNNSELSNDDKENESEIIDKFNKDKDDNEKVDDEEDDDEEESGSDEYDEIGKMLWSDEEESTHYSSRKSRSHRNRKTINYQFTEYDELINSAIQQEMDVDLEINDSLVSIGVESKGKDMSNIIANNTEELDFNSPSLEMKISDQNKDQTAVETDPQTKGEQKINYTAKDNDTEHDEDDEDQSDKSDSNVESSKAKKSVDQKRGKAKQTMTYRKRHRGLNDLDVTTEDDDDSDEDFKGDSSATEVDEGSDEEFVDDASTAEEVSDDSDYSYGRRRSARSIKKSSKKGKQKQNKRSRGGARVGKRGYRRDDFVVSSDESDSEYRPGGSRTRTRAATRKKISYREETSEEESEEDYYWNSNKSKSRRRIKSESSDEEWGGRKASKDNKSSKKGWGEEDDEEDDEEEDEEENDDDDDDDDDDDNEDDNEDEENNGDEVEKPVYKPGPKSSKTSGRILMKGKPRLSKARGLLSLKEESDEEDVDLNEKSKRNSVNKRSTKFSKLLDSESEEQVSEEDVKKVSDKSKDELVRSNKKSVNENEPVISDVKKVTNNQQLNTTQNMVTESNSSQLIITQQTSAQLIAESLPDNQSFSNNSENLKTSAASIDSSKASQMIGSRDNSQLAQTVNIAQLTQHNNYPQTEHINRQQNTITDNNTLKENNSIEEYYSLTNLDSYPTSRPPPLKPTLVNDPYLQSSSPPRILTLESNPYARHPSLDYSSAHHSLPPKALVDPRLERPFMNAPRMPTPFGGHPPNLRNELRPAPHQSSAHSFDGQTRPPYYAQQPPPPYYPRPHARQEPPFTSSHIRPATGPPVPPRTTTPTTSSTIASQPNYRPSNAGPWNQPSGNPTPTPGYNFAPHQPPPGYYPPVQSQQPSGHGVPLPPSYPASYPPNYAYFSHNSGTAPNGAFMIHNLLQHRPPNADDNNQTPISGSASGGQECRPSNESFSTYMTQQ